MSCENHKETLDSQTLEDKKLSTKETKIESEKHTSIPCFIVLHNIALRRYCIVLQIEVLQQPCIKQVYKCHIFFPAAFVHFVSLYHILIIFTELEAETEEMTELLQSPDKS